MPRYLPDPRDVTVGAKRSATKSEVTVHVKNRVPESYEDFVDSFCGGSQDRALEWVTSHVISDSNVEVRNEIEGLAPEAGESVSTFQSRLEKVAQDAIDTWNCEKTRRVGTGVTSKAKAVDELSAMVLAGKSPAEIQAKVQELAARFGIKK